MPLEKAAPGTPGFSRNIAREVEAGKPQKQAVAIAYEKSRSDGTEAVTGMPNAHLDRALAAADAFYAAADSVSRMDGPFDRIYDLDIKHAQEMIQKIKKVRPNHPDIAVWEDRIKSLRAEKRSRADGEERADADRWTIETKKGPNGWRAALLVNGQEWMNNQGYARSEEDAIAWAKSWLKKAKDDRRQELRYR